MDGFFHRLLVVLFDVIHGIGDIISVPMNIEYIIMSIHDVLGMDRAIPSSSTPYSVI